MSSGRKLEDAIGWIGRPGLSSVAWLYHILLGGPGWPHALPVGMLLVSMPLVLWCVRVVRNREWRQADDSTHVLLQFGAHAHELVWSAPILYASTGPSEEFHEQRARSDGYHIFAHEEIRLAGFAGFSGSSVGSRVPSLVGHLPRVAR